MKDSGQARSTSLSDVRSTLLLSCFPGGMHESISLAFGATMLRHHWAVLLEAAISISIKKRPTFSLEQLRIH
jgi:hypothetical protein